MDEKTILEICDRIYNNGFEIGSRHRLSRFIGYDIVKGVPLDKEKLKAMKKLRIERVLKKFGVYLVGEKMIEVDEKNES